MTVDVSRAYLFDEVYLLAYSTLSDDPDELDDLDAVSIGDEGADTHDLAGHERDCPAGFGAELIAVAVMEIARLKPRPSGRGYSRQLLHNPRR